MFYIISTPFMLLMLLFWAWLLKHGGLKTDFINNICPGALKAKRNIVQCLLQTKMRSVFHFSSVPFSLLLCTIQRTKQKDMILCSLCCQQLPSEKEMGDYGRSFYCICYLQISGGHNYTLESNGVLLPLCEEIISNCYLLLFNIKDVFCTVAKYLSLKWNLR